MMHDTDARVAQCCALSRGGFASILDILPVLKSKAKKIFGEFISKRECLEEFDRSGKVLGK